jgi:hypothetical protein
LFNSEHVCRKKMRLMKSRNMRISQLVRRIHDIPEWGFASNREVLRLLSIPWRLRRHNEFYSNTIMNIKR